MKRHTTIVGACRSWHRCAVRSCCIRFRGCRRCAPQPPANRSKRSALPGTWTLRECELSPLVQSHLLSAQTNLRPFRQAGGLPAISRGSSAATSPVAKSKTSRTAKAVPADGYDRAEATMDNRGSAWTAARCVPSAAHPAGDFAALLNLGPTADNPQGWSRKQYPTTYACS